MDRGAWRVTVQEVTKSWTWLSDQHYYYYPTYTSYSNKTILTLSPVDTLTSNDKREIPLGDKIVAVMGLFNKNKKCNMFNCFQMY